MSIRIGLYDFFAYTIPGVFYLVTTGFWLNSFGFLAIDRKTIDNLSLASLLVIVGAGYIAGLLIDPIAYKWMRIFYRRNSEIAKSAYDEFHQEHPWLVLDCRPADWVILMRAIKSKSMDAAADIEQHNVASIMLRNISLGLLITSASCFGYFLFVSPIAWNLLLSLVFLILSIVALRRSDLRRRWFYMAVFEAYSADHLPKDKLVKENQIPASPNCTDVSASEAKTTKTAN